MAWPFRRWKRGWWQEPAGWALAFALALPSSLLAIPVSHYAGAWALPAEVAGLSLALAATVGFFVIKRQNWLLAAPLSFGLSFSFALALSEGWNSQINLALVVAQVAVVVGAIGLTGATLVIAGRGFRRWNRANRDIAGELGEQIAHEGLFRDDGERIIVYAHRGRVVLRAITIVVILALFVVGGLWTRTFVANLFWQIVIAACIGFLLCVGGVSALLMLVRTVMTSPTLVVNPDGIFDNCSMIITGRGLLRWNETLGVEEFVLTPEKAITYHFLDVNVTDPRAINRRQPLWKRALAIIASQRQSMGYRIPRSLLDRPPAALVTAINRYINTHAPEGSCHKAVTDDEAVRPDEE